MANNARVGTGASVTLETSTLTANIVSIQLDREIPAVEATHLGSTGGREFIPADLENATAQLTIALKQTEAPVLGNTPEEITINFPDPTSAGTPSTFACDGIFTNISLGIEVDERMVYTATVQFTGAPTWTAEVA